MKDEELYDMTHLELREEIERLKGENKTVRETLVQLENTNRRLEDKLEQVKRMYALRDKQRCRDSDEWKQRAEEAEALLIEVGEGPY